MIRLCEPKMSGYFRGEESTIGEPKNGTFSKPLLIDALVNSPEYQMLKKTPFHEMVHLARVEWMNHLPKGSFILDIGGSAPNIDQGALIELGYSPPQKRNLAPFQNPDEGPVLSI